MKLVPWICIHLVVWNSHTQHNSYLLWSFWKQTYYRSSQAHKMKFPCNWQVAMFVVLHLFNTCALRLAESLSLFQVSQLFFCLFCCFSKKEPQRSLPENPTRFWIALIIIIALYFGITNDYESLYWREEKVEQKGTRSILYLRIKMNGVSGRLVYTKKFERLRVFIWIMVLQHRSRQNNCLGN